MSEAKSSAVRDNQLAVQEVNLTAADAAIVEDTGTDLEVSIGEPIRRVVSAVITEASGSVSAVPVAKISLKAGSEDSIVVLEDAQLAADDCLCLKYVTKA